jgi:transcriptional regulator with XRE-family HTH domain
VADKQGVGRASIATIVLMELSRRGMTAVELQRRTGVHRLRIGRWLSGSRPIRSNDLERILEALQISIVIEDQAEQNGRRARSMHAPRRDLDRRT